MSEKLLDSRDSVVDYNFDDVTADDGVGEKPVRVFGSRFDSVDFVAWVAAGALAEVASVDSADLPVVVLRIPRVEVAPASVDLATSSKSCRGKSLASWLDSNFGLLQGPCHCEAVVDCVGGATPVDGGAPFFEMWIDQN